MTISNFYYRIKGIYNRMPVIEKLYIALLIVSIGIMLSNIAGATTLTTNAATNVDTDSATFNGDLVLTVNPTSVWFEYGADPDGFKYRTPYRTMTASGAFTSSPTGAQFIAGQTIYYRTVAYENTVIPTTGAFIYGNTVSFTLSDISVIKDPYGNDYDFDNHTDALLQDNLNISAMVITIPEAYEDRVGSVFWGIVVSFVFIMVYLRQDDITLPCLLGVLIGASVWVLMPGQWVQLAYSLIVVSFAGLVYSLVKGRG